MSKIINNKIVGLVTTFIFLFIMMNATFVSAQLGYNNLLPTSNKAVLSIDLIKYNPYLESHHVGTSWNTNRDYYHPTFMKANVTNTQTHKSIIYNTTLDNTYITVNNNSINGKLHGTILLDDGGYQVINYNILASVKDILSLKRYIPSAINPYTENPDKLKAYYAEVMNVLNLPLDRYYLYQTDDFRAVLIIVSYISNLPSTHILIS